jgi:hypothetical protein
VRAWSTQARLALVLLIVQSLEQEQASMPQQSPTDLIGVWKTDQLLSDQDVAQLLEAEKMKEFWLFGMFRNL